MCTGIHPLALEDVLHQRPQARSKADYYLKHLFIRILVHQLSPDEDDGTDIESIAPPESKFVGMDVPRTSSPIGFENGYDSSFKKSEEYDLDKSNKKPDGHAKSSGYSRHSGRFITDTLRLASFFSNKPDPTNSHADLEKVSVEHPPLKEKSDQIELTTRRGTFLTEKRVRDNFYLSHITSLLTAP